MRNKILITALLITVTSISIFAQGQLDSYLTEAAQNNPGIKAKFNEYLASLEKVPQIGALPDPQVTFGYFIQPVETRVGPQRAKISASQMFPWFGALGAAKDAASDMAKVKYEAFEEAKSNLFYNIKSTYYNLYFTRKAIVITKKNIDILEILRKIALVKVESGLVSSVDVLRVEIEISNLENQLALLQDKYQTQLVGFNNLLNVSSERLVAVPDSLSANDLVYTREAILDSIRNNNHQVLQFDYQEASWKNQETAAIRSGAPKMMLGADYIITGKYSEASMSVSDAGKDAFVFPMVGITVPIYRKKYNAMVKEAQLMQESAQNNQEEKTNALETTFENANKDYLDANRRIPLYRLQSDRANKALSILRTEYETNSQNFEELLRMERQLLTYKLELEKARADKDAAVAFIEYLMGE